MTPLPLRLPLRSLTALRWFAPLAALACVAPIAAAQAPAGAATALVYCPVGLDTGGCDNVVTALAAPGSAFGRVDRGYDGTGGTVDLATTDLTAYAVIVVPSLADGVDGRPYDRLRDATVATRIKAALVGRGAVWSGTPDLGTTNVAEKTSLLQNLAAWAMGGAGTGLVALLDNSDDPARRYDWVPGISALGVTADTSVGSYASVQSLTPIGAAIVNGGGQPLSYPSMAAFGLHAGTGATEDVIAGSGGIGPAVLVTTAGGSSPSGGSAPATPPVATGPRALVYCPIGIDSQGCDNVIAALSASGTPFTGGADRAYDGSPGTVDLRIADLSSYGVFVVPSLADGADGQPYAVLRDPVVAGRLKPLLAGPVAVWSGTPDLGDSSRVQKNLLLMNLARWAAAAAGARGLVALQDASDSVPMRYSWLSLISRVSVAADTALNVYNNVQALTPTAVSLLANGSGLQLGYANMASYGLLPVTGLGADATGGRTSSIVLATSASVGGAGAGFATVTTDRDDYQPGDTITVTGAGWAPGETVSLLFHEQVDPPIHPDKTLTTVADANGRIFDHEYGVEDTDVGVRFTLTATGQTSGRTAQATFTDAAGITITVATVNGGATTNVVVGQAITAAVTANATSDTWMATRFSTTPATTSPCVDHADHAAPSTATETFTITAPATPGTYSAIFDPFRNNTCNGNGNAGTGKTLANAIVVAKGGTTTAVASSGNPSVFGQPVTFTATVAAVAPATGTPTGTVTFKDGAATLGTGTLNASGQATFSTSTLAVGSHSITAAYAGDGSYNASTSPALTQGVNQASTSTALASSANPSTFGQAVTFTATVTAVAPGAGTPAGTVQFKVDGANLGSLVALNASGVASSIASSSLSVGSHPVAAVYSGSTSYAASTSTVIATQTVQPAATTTTIISDSPDPSAIGQSVTVNYTVVVASPGAGTPTGNVTVSDGTDSCTGTVAAGTCSISLNTAGARTLTATYAGDGSFATSISAGVGHQVNQIGTTTAVASSLNPSSFGQLVTFTATVTSGVNPVTVGSVTFIEGGTCAAPTNTLQAAQAVTAGGQATFATSALAVGSHTVVACYGGSGSFAASNGNVVQTVNLAPTTVAVAAASGTFGGTATLSATLTRTADGPIAGKSVSFTLNGSPKGSATTDASGVATIASASLSGINAGTYPAGVSASFAGDASFATSSGSASLTVTPATVTVTVTVIPTSITYGGTVELDADLSPALSGKTISFSIDGTPVGTDATNGSGKAKLMAVNPASVGLSAGSHTVTATFPAELNFAAATGTGSLTIAQVATTTAVTSSLNPSTFGQAVTFTATVSSTGGTPSGSATFIEGGTCASPVTTLQAATPLDGAGKATFPSSSLTAGLHTVTACFGGSNNFAASSGNAAQTVNKATPTVTWANPGDITYGTALGATQLNATASVPGAFVYAPAAGAVPPAGNGQTLSVNFTPTDAANYNSVPGTTVTINVLQRSVTPSITAGNKPYDGTTAATIATRSLTGVFGTDDVTLTGGIATFDSKSAGMGKTVTATGLALAGTAAANYALSSTSATTTANVTPRPLAVTASGQNKEYDGTTTATVTLADDRIPGDILTTSYAAATFADKNVGTGKTVNVTGISVSGSDAGNYTPNATATTTADITARALTVTADPKTKGYGDADPALTYHLTSGALVPGDGFTGALIRAPGEAVAGSPYAIQQGTLTAGPDYMISFTGASFTITARPLTVTATGTNKVYDATTTASVTLADNRIGGDVFTASYASAAFADKHVGTAKPMSVTGISLSGPAAGNYVLASTTAAATADITPASVTGSFTVADKIYDATTSATITTRAVAGVIGSDDVSLTGGVAAFADKHVGTGKTVTATGLTLSGADGGNYLLSSSTATAAAAITPASLTPHVAAENRVYDGTTAATLSSRTPAGVITPDVVTLSGGTATFSDKNVGTGKTVTAISLTLAGADAGNYQLTSASATTTADITALGITGHVTADDKVYDGTAAALISGRTLIGVIAPDVVSLIGGTASFTDKNAGAGKTVTATGLSLSGADAANYTVNGTATTTASITPRSLHVTASGTDKVYDGTTTSTVTLADDRIAGDVLTPGYAAANFADKHVGTAKPVSVSGISLSGPDGANYVANPTATSSASITPRTLTVSASGVDRVYDGTTAATAHLTDDRIAGDNLTASYASATFADKNVGTGKTVSLAGIGISGPDAGNYILASTSTTTTASMTPRALAVSAAGQDKQYDATVGATVTLLDDRVSGDVLALAYSAATFADKNVGVGKTVTVTGIGVTGPDAGNYTFNSTASASASITPAPLAVSATGVNKVYDATAAATVLLAATPLATDVIALSYAGASFADKNVGTSKTVSVTGISVGGTDGGNYSPNGSTSATADITALGITGSITASNRVYDGGTAATIATRTLTGVLGTDAVSLSGGTASFADKNVGTGKTVTATGLSLSGADAGNYTVNSTATATANITALSITGTIAAANKVYNGTTAAIISSRALSGQVASDAVSYVGGTATFTTKDVGTAKTVTATGLSLSGADAINYTVNSTATTTADITPATSSTLVTSSPLSIPYSDGAQSVTLSATVTSPTVPGISEGVMTFTLKNASNVTVGTASAPISVLGGSATTTYTVPGMTDVGTYTIQAAFAGTNFGPGSAGTGGLTVQPADFQATTATTDADFHETNDLDVLFKSDPKLTTLQLKNTNPGTVHYQLTYANVTGVDINAANGATLKTVIEIPPMTNCGGVSCAASVDKTVAAWSLKGAKAIHVWPDDRTDDMPVQFTYKATGDCAVDGGSYTTNLSSIPSAAPKCIMVTGFAIPKKHRARLDLHLEFRWKESGNWAASPDPKLYFYSGFAFKSTSTANYPNVVPSVRTSMQSAGLVAAGQRVTAAGGFIFDPAGNPAADYHVRLFNLAGDASAPNACAAVNSKVVADTKVSADGFWFVWKTGVDQMNTMAPGLPSKVQYSVVVCSSGPTPASVAMRTMSGKMPDKEFDQEDFSLPTVIATGP